MFPRIRSASSPPSSSDTSEDSAEASDELLPDCSLDSALEFSYPPQPAKIPVISSRQRAAANNLFSFLFIFLPPDLSIFHGLGKRACAQPD